MKKKKLKSVILYMGKKKSVKNRMYEGKFFLEFHRISFLSQSIFHGKEKKSYKKGGHF